MPSAGYKTAPASDGTSSCVSSGSYKPQGKLDDWNRLRNGPAVGSYFFRTSDEIKQVHDFYEDNMTRAPWEVSRAPTQVWGSSEAEGRKFEVTPERRGDDTRVRVAFEEKDQN